MDLPSPDLPTADHRLCLEGNGRLAAVRQLGRPFWAFDLGRFVPEEERIRLMFHHHGTRRRMGREEIAERAVRYIEITGCPAAEAARVLGCSQPTLSRAFGEAAHSRRSSGPGPTCSACRSALWSPPRRRP